MDRSFPFLLVWFIFGIFSSLLLLVYGNLEGDALYTQKEKFTDPTNVLQTWDATLANPCRWFHVTCNNKNSVTGIDLGSANLSGQLVPDLGQLRNLQYLELSNNNITGKIPSELGNLTQLLSLNLYQNQLDSDIPATLGNLQKLQSLRLNNNMLNGTIPSSLTTINTLQVLDLSYNLLSGYIPVTGSFTKFTNISFAHNNQLILPTPVGQATAPNSILLTPVGQAAPPAPNSILTPVRQAAPPAPPTSPAPNSILTPVGQAAPPAPPTSPAPNSILTPQASPPAPPTSPAPNSILTPQASPPAPPISPAPNSILLTQAPAPNSPFPSAAILDTNRSTAAIAGGVAAGAALLFGTLSAIAWWWCRKPPDHFFDLPAEEDPANHLEQLKRFSLHELKVATDSFSKNNILGQGGFGNVYKGWLADGSLVAVKRLKEERKLGDELQFQTEVEIISLAVHRNLLRLIGFCITPTERLLVYPYMVNGSVASCLKGRPNTKPALDWATRKRIAVGSARGLAYLHDHCTPKIIHRDVKAANIMLDEEFEAVVGDFGLAKLLDYNATHVTTAVRGTIGHLAPEYLSTGRCSEKTDVYGYGVFLLELITGQQAYDLARLQKDDSVMLLDWVKGLLEDKKLETLVDTDLEVNGVNDDVEKLIQIALLCTQERAMERPNMSEVIRMLEGDGLANKWEEWQKEDISQRKFSNTDIPYPDFIQIISNYTPSADQLSAPR